MNADFDGNDFLLLRPGTIAPHVGSSAFKMRGMWNCYAPLPAMGHSSRDLGMSDRKAKGTGPSPPKTGKASLLTFKEIQTPRSGLERLA